MGIYVRGVEGSPKCLKRPGKISNFEKGGIQNVNLFLPGGSPLHSSVTNATLTSKIHLLGRDADEEYEGKMTVESNIHIRWPNVDATLFWRRCWNRLGEGGRG